MAPPGNEPSGILAGARAALVSDALDRLGCRDQAMSPAIEPLWPGARLVGRAVPVIVRESDGDPEQPYASEMRALDSLSPGDVAVYSAQADVRAALWGELFSYAAMGRGATGAVVDGYVRDAAQIAALGYPVFSRGRSLLDTLGRAEVTEIGVPAVCAGVLVNAGDLIVGDDDGVVVVPHGLVEDVAAAIGERARNEHGALTDLQDGATIRQVWDKWRVL